MKSLFTIFLPCLCILTGILYFFSGGIWMQKEISPISIVESSSEEEQPIMTIPTKEKDLEIYAEHHITGGNYVILDEVTGEKSVVVFFEKIQPLKNNEALLTNAHCIYYANKNQDNENLPAKFVLDTATGRLQFDAKSKKMQFLYADEDVLVHGYDRSVTDDEINAKTAPYKMTMTGKKWKVNLETHEIETEQAVHITQWNNQKQKILTLSGIGMKGNADSFTATLYKNNEIHFFPMAFQNNDKISIEEAISTCDGIMTMLYNKEAKEITFKQNKKVQWTTKQAKLTCDHLDMLLFQNEKQISWKNIHAQGHVHLYDTLDAKEQNLFCDKLNAIQEQNGNIKVKFLGKCKLDLQGLSAFSVLDEENRIRFEREEQRKKIQTLHATCNKQIYLTRTLNKKGEFEQHFYFYGNAVLKQTGVKIPYIQLEADNIHILAETVQKKTKKTFQAKYLKAKKNVYITHSQGNARGDYFQWNLYNEDYSRLILQGNPTCILKNIDGQESDIAFMKMSDLNNLQNKKKTEKNKTAPQKEDIKIDSKGTMILDVRKQNKKRNLEYKTEKDVVILRLKAGTQETISKLYCQKIQSKISSIPTKTKNNIKKNKMDLSFLHAQDKISFDFSTIQGSGENLLFDRKTLTLEKNAYLKTEQGTLKGEKFFYNIDKEEWEATGNLVTFDSNEYCAESNSVLYDKKQDTITLQGIPAKVSKKKDENELAQTLYAKKITYNKTTGLATATDNVEVITIADSSSFNNMASLMTSEKQSNKIKTLENKLSEKSKKYRITANSFTAKINPETQELEEFSTDGIVHANNLCEESNTKPETIDGTKLIFKDGHGILYGNPAKVIYQGNSIESNEIVWLHDKKTLFCQGPITIFVDQQDSNLLGAMNNFNTPQNIKEQVKKNQEDRVQEHKNNEEKIKITSSGPLYYYQEKGELELQDKIYLQSSDGIISCDLIRIIQKDNEVQKIVAHGNVRMDSDVNHADADRLTWNAKSDSILLVGSPSVHFSTKDFSMDCPIVSYNIKEKRFITKSKNILIQGAIPQNKKFSTTTKNNIPTNSATNTELPQNN